jgi:GAF domain-containing protein
MFASSKAPSSINEDQEFHDSQMLPPDQRGVSFEALFYRQLQAVAAKIHDTDNLDQIMLEVSQDVCRLFNADRLTIYATNDEKTAIVSKVKTGLNTAKELKLPIGTQSIAGYVAFAKQMVNIADVYDADALTQIHPELKFLKEVDKRSGYRTKQMMVVPIQDGQEFYGVMQVINNRSDVPFGRLDEEGSTQLCRTLATALRHRLQRERDLARKRATKYDGVVKAGHVSAEQLQQTISRSRDEGKSVEHMLMADLQIRPAQIGPSLAEFFGVPYEPFSAGRIRSEALHGALKREFVEEQRWIPLEEGTDGLVIMCVDPEATRGAHRPAACRHGAWPRRRFRRLDAGIGRCRQRTRQARQQSDHRCLQPAGQ